MRRPTDHDLDLSVAAMLRLGVGISAVMVIVGGVMLLLHPYGSSPDYTHFVPGNPALRTFPGILQGAIDLAPKSLIQLGLVLLIATPIARVVLCVVGFARQRDLRYVGISLLVLMVLLYSFTRGQ